MICKECDFEGNVYYEKLQNIFRDSNGLIQDIYLESIKQIERADSNYESREKFSYMYDQKKFMFGKVSGYIHINAHKLKTIGGSK